MDDTMNRLAREMADAISAAVASDPKVEACRQRAREAGYELQLSIEANIGFAARGEGDQNVEPPAPRPLEMTANDRRFLRSLRIAPDETIEEV